MCALMLNYLQRFVDNECRMKFLSAVFILNATHPSAIESAVYGYKP